MNAGQVCGILHSDARSSGRSARVVIARSPFIPGRLITPKGFVLVCADPGRVRPRPGDSETDGYFWGANSELADNAIVLAVAGEPSVDGRYRAGALEAMDHLLGRNALGQSYVTGYGGTSSCNRHHRFWAHQADVSPPNPPAGPLAGGPNSALQDPVAQERPAGCAPAACCVDDIGSSSPNEVAVNRNAPSARLAAFAAEWASAGEQPGAACAVTYRVDNAWSDGFTATVTAGRARLPHQRALRLLGDRTAPAFSPDTGETVHRPRGGAGPGRHRLT
ncbi:glycoside hydrolase family 9 protein [Streptomyces caelestis]